MSTHPSQGSQVATQSIVRMRMARESYKQLERQVGVIHVGDKTTDQQTAYQLGIQRVLQVLRDDFVEL